MYYFLAIFVTYDNSRISVSSQKEWCQGTRAGSLAQQAKV